MGALQHRKLWDEAFNETVSEFCSSGCKQGYCSPGCEIYCRPACNDFCPSSCLSNDPPSKPKKVLVAILLVAAIAFSLVCCYAIYVKFYVIPRRRRISRQGQRIENRDEFLDENHGPVVEHHIWYINTVGLQPSVISSIAVCKYKRGDGLVDGTDCSVCLNEFQEDESLRLLPKCSHAFHIPCIDTWLRSHTNCPLCRAPIVTDTVVATSSDASIGTTSTEEEIQVGVMENRESDRPIDDGDADRRLGAEEGGESERLDRRSEEDGIQPMRRSVSLDSLSAFKISQALANVHLAESDGSSGLRLPRPVKGNGSNMEIVAKRGGGNQSLLKFMASSSFGRTLQIGPSSIKRSLSCNGKLFLSRYCRNRNSVLPS